MLEYTGQGTELDLRGNERFVWPQLKSQLDRDNEKYEEFSKIRSEAGQQGGLAKASKRKQKEANEANVSFIEVYSYICLSYSTGHNTLMRLLYKILYLYSSHKEYRK
jgi:hypothetical protein